MTIEEISNTYINISQKYQDQKVVFIKALHNLLPYYQWDMQLIHEVEAECGFERNYHYIIFGTDIADIVDFYEEWQDRLMLNYLKNEQEITKVRDKIARAVKIRIARCSSAIHHKKNKDYFLQIKAAAQMFKVAWRSSDVIWRYVGDTSTDFNYYSKRTILSSLYISSIMYYITNCPDNNEKFEQFVDQAIAKILNIGNLTKQLKIPSITDIPIVRLFL